MSHKDQLEKSKYRNWVRGELAYQYLKEGIEGFADEVVQKEHTRIRGVVNNTSGNACNQCDLSSLKPVHSNVAGPTPGRKMCPWGQYRCNCLSSKKKPCPNKVCDVIMEEILKSHGSTPPAPNWKNTDVNKWYTCPWEIANCFIYAPGYSGKSSAAEIDISGLLHLFINNTNLHRHISCNMTGTNIFIKCREGRNKIYHSSTMELEDTELTECIGDTIAVLKDPKELAHRADAKHAVSKLKQLQQAEFVITTHNEIETCRTALDFITKKSKELTEDIHNAKDAIDLKKEETITAIDDETKHAVEAALKEIDTQKTSLNQRFDQLEMTIMDIKQVSGDSEPDYEDENNTHFSGDPDPDLYYEDENNTHVKTVVDVDMSPEAETDDDEHLLQTDSGLSASDSLGSRASSRQSLLSSSEENTAFFADAYRNVIKYAIKVPNILTYLPLIDKKQADMIRSINNFCESDAVELLLDTMKSSKTEGIWQSFLDALDKLEHTNLRKILCNETEIHYNHKSEILRLITPQLQQRICFPEFLDIVFQKELLTEIDKDEVESTLKLKGPISAAGILLEKVDKHSCDWDKEFIDILDQSGMADITPLFKMIEDNEKPTTKAETTLIQSKTRRKRGTKLGTQRKEPFHEELNDT